MALRFLDGFDHYTSLAQKYEIAGTGEIGSTGGRTGNGYFGASEFRKTLAANTQWIVGCAFRIPSPLVINNAIIRLYEQMPGGPQITVTFDTDYRFRVRRGGDGGTIIGASTNSFVLNAWYYIEFKVTIHSTAGSFELRVNGTTETSASSVNTRGGSQDATDRVGFSGGGTVKHFDDIYICDGDGSTHNDFLGDCKILTLFPNGAGNYTQWTPSTGSNWQNVDDNPPNGDTDYNSTSTATNKDTYALSDITLTGNVKGIQVLAMMRKDDAGSRSSRLLIRTASTDYSGPTVGHSDNYVYLRNVWQNNPNTSAAWTVAQVNALEAGVELVS